MFPAPFRQICDDGRPGGRLQRVPDLPAGAARPVPKRGVLAAQQLPLGIYHVPWIQLKPPDACVTSRACAWVT